MTIQIPAGNSKIAMPRVPDPVTYILYSETTGGNLIQRLGRPEYSYFFVREIFRAMLAVHAQTVVVTDPEIEVDRIYDECAARGEQCVFLSFAPPHRSFIDLRCPTIPVFAWEFDTIPTETWDDDVRNDWRIVLSRLGRAITHSSYGTKAVRDGMHSSFPVESIPAPIWDRERCAAEGFCERSDTEIAVKHLLDSRLSPPVLHYKADKPDRADKPETALHRFAAKWRRSFRKRLYRQPAEITLLQPAEITRFTQNEIVYTSVFNPYDGRKNWQDTLSAFCIACAERPDATLVFKLVHHDNHGVFEDIKIILARLPPHQCRVVVIGDFLDDRSYRKLIAASTFVVNTSLSEGQCLPLMEFMSWGKPALAPKHTGVAEYIDDSVAFVIDLTLEPCSWPHDPRGAVRTHRFRINWESVARAFAESYRMAKSEPQRYARMSKDAIAKQRDFCSEAVVYTKLKAFFCATSSQSQGDHAKTDDDGRPWTDSYPISQSNKV